MSPREWTERIRDILDAIQEIQGFVQGMDYETFQQDLRTLRAVELNFIVIGEAANHIPEDVQEAHPEIPWHLMRAMRNRLVHVYFSVDPDLVWDTVQNDLPPLVPALETLL
jgi:uncharacterized protein with HEPN domain